MYKIKSFKRGGVKKRCFCCFKKNNVMLSTPATPIRKKGEEDLILLPLILPN
jgi:hypothetical protein